MLSESLMKAGLFDEIRLCVAPMMLGKGRRLFTGGYSTRHLQLLEARPLANSAVILRYEVVDA
jgi:riboflavin biosynthesis pyrimidine reductase